MRRSNFEKTMLVAGALGLTLTCVTLGIAGKLRSAFDKASYEEPLRYSEGIQFVLVNGVAVVKEGRLVDGVLPGRAARAPIS
jgi:hypothetical protein